MSELNGWKSVGKIKSIFRYPVKGMAGQSLETAELYWHGIQGDRRFALVNRDDINSGFPWMTGRLKAQMIRYQPSGDIENGEISVETPTGERYPLQADELKTELTDLFGKSLDWVQISRGCFDTMPLSFISTDTVAHLCAQAGEPTEVRRFRPNILVETESGEPFAEEDWLGYNLRFGESDTAPMIFVARQNVRCVMTNLNPDTAVSNPKMLKYIAKEREAKAGLYGFILRIGDLAVGDVIQIRPVG